MSCTEIEFGVTDINLIKNETDFKWETLDNNSSEEFEDFFNNSAKCGDVFYSTNGDFAFSCCFCGGKFRGFDRFVRHVNETHFDLLNQKFVNDMEIGPEEILEYSVKESLADRTSTGGKSHSTEERKLVDVKVEIKKEIPETHECVMCKQNFDTHFLLTEHRKVHLEETGNNTPEDLEVDSENFGTDLNQELLKCRHCDRKFKRQHNLMVHEKKHVKGTLTFPCTFCPKSFPRESQMKDHLNTHTGARPHKCKECHASYGNFSNLQVHIRRVHTDEKRYQCEFCEKGYVTTSELRIHVRSHTGERPYKCEECGKGFVTGTARLVHMRSHTGERPYQCEQCGVKLMSAGAFSVHKKRHQIESRRLTCQICGKRFLNRPSLREHMTVHSNERQFECSICSATFPRRKALISHAKIHACVKEYVCKICGKEFSQGPGLYSHMKSHGIHKNVKAQ